RDAEGAAGKTVFAVKYARAGEHLAPVDEDGADQHGDMVCGAKDRPPFAADHLHARPLHPGEDCFALTGIKIAAGLREDRHLMLAVLAEHPGGPRDPRLAEETGKAGA